MRRIQPNVCRFFLRVVSTGHQLSLSMSAAGRRGRCGSAAKRACPARGSTPPCTPSSPGLRNNVVVCSCIRVPLLLIFFAHFLNYSPKTILQHVPLLAECGKPVRQNHSQFLIFCVPATPHVPALVCSNQGGRRLCRTPRPTNQPCLFLTSMTNVRCSARTLLVT